MRVFRRCCASLIFLVVAVTGNDERTRVNYVGETPLFSAIPQVIYQAAMLLSSAIFPSFPSQTLRTHHALRTKNLSCETLCPERTLMVAYRYPRDIIRHEAEGNVSFTTEETSRRHLAPSDGMASLVESLLQELLRIPETVLTASSELLGVSRDELSRAQQSARLSLEAMPDTLTAQQVEKIGDGTVQRLQRGVVVLRLLNKLMAPLIGLDSQRHLNDLLEAPPFYATYLPALHMETLEVPSKEDAEAYRDILISDANVQDVYFDQVVNVSPFDRQTSVYEDASESTPPLASHVRRSLREEDAFSITSDPLFPQQWALHASNDFAGATNIAAGWSLWSGENAADRVTIALIDSGVDLNHPDLVGRFWKNPDEICDNGIDDDANGYIDDCYGWDFVDRDNKPEDENGHGTASAGIIAAHPNNKIGVAPVCWNCDILNLRVLNAENRGPVSEFLRAFDYALTKRVRISNNSYGGHDIQYNALEEAIRRAGKSGMIFVAASGNDGMNNDIGQFTIYPSSFRRDNILSVAAVTSDGTLASFSNFGHESVSIGAPGTNILTTALGGGYAVVEGTSFATPHVAGVIGLLWGFRPMLNYTDVLDIVRESARPMGAMTHGLAALERAAQGSCPKGQSQTQSGSCEHVNECLIPNKCPTLSGVRCINYERTYECRCPPGLVWDGAKACRVVNYPSFGRCQNNGACGVNSLCRVDLFRGMSCLCLQGYTKHPRANLCIREGLETMDPDDYLKRLAET